MKLPHWLKCEYTMWEQYVWRGFRYPGPLDGFRDRIEVTVTREKRKCKICGRVRDRKIRNG